MNDSSDCGDFDEGGSGDMDTSGESSDVGSTVEDSEGAAEEAGGCTDVFAASTDAGGCNMDLGGSNTELGSSVDKASEPGIEVAHANRTEAAPANDKTCSIFVPSDRTITDKTLEDVSQQAHKTALEYAAKKCPEREREFNARANEKVTGVKLESEKNLGKNVLGAHNMRTHDISVLDELTEKAATHVCIHEETHKASYQEKEITADEINTTEKMTSGIKEATTVTDNKTGEKMEHSSKNTALNEGITEEYATRAAWEAGMKDSGVEAYSTNRQYASSLESLVGGNLVSEAFYNGGAKELADRVNELGKSENTWETFNSQLDVLTAPTDKLEGKALEQAIQSKKDAQTQLNEILATMNKSRMEEISDDNT